MSINNCFQNVYFPHVRVNRSGVYHIYASVFWMPIVWLHIYEIRKAPLHRSRLNPVQSSCILLVTQRKIAHLWMSDFYMSFIRFEKSFAVYCNSIRPNSHLSCFTQSTFEIWLHWMCTILSVLQKGPSVQTSCTLPALCQWYFTAVWKII